MEVLLSIETKSESEKAKLDRTIRFLVIKLVNAIDTAKQHPIFDCIHKQLFASEELQESKVFMGLQLYLDVTKLKLGSRVSHVAVI